jgi:hypothetical protein
MVVRAVVVLQATLAVLEILQALHLHREIMEPQAEL